MWPVLALEVAGADKNSQFFIFKKSFGLMVSDVPPVLHV